MSWLAMHWCHQFHLVCCMLMNIPLESSQVICLGWIQAGPKQETSMQLQPGCLGTCHCLDIWWSLIFAAKRLTMLFKLVPPHTHLSFESSYPVAWHGSSSPGAGFKLKTGSNELYGWVLVWQAQIEKPQMHQVFLTLMKKSRVVAPR